MLNYNSVSELKVQFSDTFFKMCLTTDHTKVKISDNFGFQELRLQTLLRSKIPPVLDLKMALFLFSFSANGN